MRSNNIRLYRLKQGLTLQQLAKLVNLSTGYVCHLEKGSRSNPSIDVMERFSVVFNKSISDIFLL